MTHRRSAAGSPRARRGDHTASKLHSMPPSARWLVSPPKPQIALEQLRWACEAGLPRGVALLDAGYGASTDLRTSITALDLMYVAGILPNTSVWPMGEEPL